MFWSIGPDAVLSTEREHFIFPKGVIHNL